MNESDNCPNMIKTKVITTKSITFNLWIIDFSIIINLFPSDSDVLAACAESVLVYLNEPVPDCYLFDVHPLN